MAAGSTRGAILKRGIVFFVDSTLFVSVAPAVITCVTIILTQNPFNWQLVLLPFFACLLIYSVNRLTDQSEDAINMPDRVRFPYRMRIFLVVISLIFTFLLLMMVLQKNLLSFVIGLVPMVIAFLYSVLRLKRIFILKNILIAAAVGSSVLIVPAYYENWSGVTWELLFLFFLLLVFLNTIIFDIKDIRGDSVFGIRTLPLQLGIPATKYFCYILLITAFVVFFPLLFVNEESILLIPYMCTIALYTHSVPDDEHFPWWYFGVLVDGEFLILLLSLSLVILLF